MLSTHLDQCVDFDQDTRNKVSFPVLVFLAKEFCAEHTFWIGVRTLLSAQETR